MAHDSRLSKVAHSFFSALLMMLFAPVALAAPANPGINDSGEWYLPGPGIVHNETNEPGEDIYIIRHQAPSLAQYRGDIPGLAATSPAATGAPRLNPRSNASQAYLAYLAGIHADLEAAIEASLGRDVDVVHRYDAAYNGIAVRMTASEAQQISSLSGIQRVTRDYARKLLTDAGPQWIGAEAIHDGSAVPGGLGNMGEGIVVGIIDTGVNFDHPSFADIGGDGYDHTSPVLTYRGVCSGQVAGTPGLCNDKLIGLYDFTQTTPEDGIGHGSHTASTTAGNFVTAQMFGPTITVTRPISGVAPHANIISYKACQELTGNCLISGILGSINAATLDADIVDVINYSIGGGSANPWVDDDAQAFFDAYTAGIFIATSAGNSGPGFGTLGSPADAPWVTSVGASTHNRQLANGVVDMNGGNTAAPADIEGAGITAGYGPAKIVWAGDYEAQFQGSDPSQARLCGAGVGDPATGQGSEDPPWPPGTFNGEIVLCERGEFGRVHKGQNVLDAGAGGYILMNDVDNGDSLVADAHVLPGVHISHANGNVLKAWLADGASDHMGSIRGMETNLDPANGDKMASFSSRGANPAVPGVIKPDVTAPGVDILAAYHTPAGTLPGSPDEYNIISGTSMSSPHTAGAAALLRAAHPDWSPDEVKSALMSVAFTTLPGTGNEVHGVFKEDGATPADPFDMGAGRVDLRQSALVGFVLDESPDNYDAANPGIGGDARTLNMASLGNELCPTTCSWTRTIKGTAPGTVNWSTTTTTPAGMSLTVEPSNFSLAEGEHMVITITADVKDVADKGEWTFAEVQFNNGSGVPNAHFPVAVIPAGGQPPVTLHMHGNLHDGCTGDGAADLGTAGEGDCTPFLGDDELDTSPPAHWGPLAVGPDCTGDRCITDPNWIWDVSDVTGGVTLQGTMTVEWWFGGPGVNTLLFDDFEIRLYADGTEVLRQVVRHNVTAPNVPEFLRSAVDVPHTKAFDNFVLVIDPVFANQNGGFIYYDSEANCPGVLGAVPCDSRVNMPVVGTEPQPPVATDDEVFVLRGDSVDINVLANDFDPEGGPLSVEIISDPAHGTVEETAGSLLRYTHNGSLNFSDQFDYRITDVQGLTDEGTVFITIGAACFETGDDYSDDFESGSPGWGVDTALITPPSFTWDEFSPDPFATSGSTVWFTDANAGDGSGPTTKDVRLVSPEQLVSPDTHLTFWHRFNTEVGFDGGVLEVSVDGGSTWEDVLDAGGVFVANGYNGVLNPGSDFVLSGREAWQNESDGFLVGAMQQVEVDLGALAGSTVKVRFRFAQDELLPEPAGGWWIDDVTFTDLWERCPAGVPRAFADSDTVLKGGMVTTDVKANDEDEDHDNSLLTVEVIADPQHGTAVVEPDGRVKYTHNGDSATSDTYEYKLTDPDGNFDTAFVTITIEQPPNQEPVANNDPGNMVDADGSVTIDVKANDSDPDHDNDELTVTIESQPASGVAAVNGDGTITYTHGGDAATSDSFEYRLTDPEGAFDTATVSITIKHDGGGGDCRNDLCADDEKPAELTLTFIGGVCANSENTQGSKDDCTDHEPGGASGDVFIRATNKEDADYDNAKVWFEGDVSEGETFTLQAALADKDDFGSKVFIHIYDSENGTLLQTVEIHTSCSAPLIEGERFGALKLGEADSDPSDPICSAGEGRVHGSGHWRLDNFVKYDKIDFSFDAKVYKGGLKGKLKVHDKDMDLKIDAKTITSLSTGENIDCAGNTLDGTNSFAFTATGTFEIGDDEYENAQFFACGEDNGKNKEPPVDNLHVECFEGCAFPYRTSDYTTGTDIDGGNIHLHDPIVNSTSGGGSSASTSGGASAPAEGGTEQGGAGSEPQGTSSEPEGSSDVVTLEPMLLSTVPAGTPMVVTAIVETHGGVIDGTPVTLRWTTAGGLQGETTAIANELGIAAFVVTVPAGDVEYTAWAGELDSNGMRVTGF